MRDGGTANKQYTVANTQSQPGKNPQVRRVKGYSSPEARSTRQPSLVGRPGPVPEGGYGRGQGPPALMKDVEEVLQDRALVAEERRLRDPQGPSQSLQCLDRRCDMTVLIAGQSGFGDPRDLLKVRLGVSGPHPRLAQTLAKRPLIVHETAPSIAPPWRGGAYQCRTG